MEKTQISKSRQILGSDVLKAPGLSMMGHNQASRASSPLKQHRHPGLVECVVILRGNECYAAGGHSYPLEGGDVFITPSGQLHGNGTEIQGICEIIWFQLDPQAENVLGLAGQEADALRSQLSLDQVRVLQADDEGINLLKKSLAGFLRREETHRKYALFLFNSFLVRLLFLQQDRRTADDQVQQAIAIIDASLQTHLTLESLSEQCGISLSGLKHKFRARTGKTPRDYINQQKIELGCSLLQSGQSVTETAMALGFSSSSYFSVVFRKFMNCSPSQFAVRKSDPADHSGAADLP